MSLKSRIEALRLGIERIPSGDKYKELIGKGSIFSTNLDTNETARKMVMAPDKIHSLHKSKLHFRQYPISLR